MLRYGSLYGPGTAISRDGEFLKLVQKRRFPILGDGAGVWSFIHVDHAARATQLALECGIGGIFNIVDDEPAEVSVWLPKLAEISGAKPPRRLPAWVGRWFVGDAGMCMMTEARGSSSGQGKNDARLAAGIPDLARRISLGSGVVAAAGPFEMNVV